MKATIIIIGILIAMYNGLYIKHYQTRDPKYSVRWHRVGWFIRAGLMVALWPDWLMMLIYLNVAWTMYDMIINLYMGQKLFYQGKTAWFDKTFPRWLLLTAKGILLAGTIYALTI